MEFYFFFFHATVRFECPTAKMGYRHYRKPSGIAYLFSFICIRTKNYPKTQSIMFMEIQNTVRELPMPGLLCENSSMQYSLNTDVTNYHKKKELSFFFIQTTSLPHFLTFIFFPLEGNSYYQQCRPVKSHLL